MIHLPSVQDLKKLHLHDNPWECDCGLGPLVAWLGATRVDLHPLDSLRCEGPPKLRSQALNKVTTAKLQCQA